VALARHLSEATDVRVNSIFRPSLWLKKGLEFLACARTDVFIKFDLHLIAVCSGLRLLSIHIT